MIRTNYKSMLSLNSLSKKNIEEAREEFVNHVFSRVFIKLCKTLDYDGERILKDLKNKSVEEKYFRMYSGTHGFTIKNEVDFLKKHLIKPLVEGDLYELISSKDMEDLIKKSKKYFGSTEQKKLIAFEKRIDESKKKKDAEEGKIKSSKEYILLKEKSDLLEGIFDYEALNNGYKRTISKREERLYDLYDLGGKLGLRTCPYCNKNYVFTISDKSKKSGKLVNATFDHWFSKSKYPLLKISFYNLIPSCSNCNSSIKKDDNFHTDTHIHPYLAPKDLTRRYEFNYFEDENKHPVVHIDYFKDDKLSKKLRTTFSDFKTEKIYGGQMLELKDMIELSNEYGEDYIDSLQKAFPDADLSKERIYNILFNTSEIDENHHLRPLSKFRFDILKKLKII